MLVMHISTLSPGGGGLYHLYNINTWIFASSIISFGLLNASKRKNIQFSPPLFLIFVGLALLIVPSFYEHSSTYHFFPRLLTLLGLGLFLFSLYQFKINRKDAVFLLLLILIAIGIQGILGILQIYLFNYLDFNFGAYAYIGDRPSGIFRQPNVMASLMATGIGIALYLLHGESKLPFLSKGILTLIYLVLFCCTLVLVTLQSKTGYLGALLVAFIYLSLLIKGEPLFKKAYAVLILALILGVTTINTIQSLDRGDNLYKDNGVRSEIYYVTAKTILDNPISGVGYGNFEREYRERFIRLKESGDLLRNPIPNLTHPHNEVLYWVVEGGIVSLLGVVFIFVAGSIIMLRERIFHSIIPISLLLPMLVHTQTEYPFYQSLPHLVVFLILFRLVDEKNKPLKSINTKSRKLINLGAILVPVLVIPFMITAVHTMVSVSNYYFSQPKNYTYIDNIINKLSWDDYIEQLRYERNLKSGLKNNDVDLLLNYLAWADERVSYEPRDYLYNNILFVINRLEFIGLNLDGGLKEKIVSDAKNLYPEFRNVGKLPVYYKTM